MRQIRRSHQSIAKIQLLLSAIATAFGFFAAPVQAQDSFANNAVEFPVDTTVEFEFKESHGAYQSRLGVINLNTRQEVELFREVQPYDGYQTGQPQVPVPGQDNTNTQRDFLGSVAGGTVQDQFKEFTFKANTPYAFFLESTSPSGQTRRNVLSTDQLGARFDGSLDAGDRGEIVGSRIAWDDDGLPVAGKDNDFDDFIIEAGGYLVTAPCPQIK